ncbi:hypothetical protein G7062_04200 [Erysipelothrix sp. HDW6C]|uniref:hypothetical protein n=1 Tax=Erysipelothrix sp. HDW6C TaxID=2714930 RepID=UPI001409DDFC|nr:hypothetical protein [Erysipelothrix sp. HDW6C]QIK69545.1 hypothetical protein G7062_04200 [Erysipelothrix sp. HDW6C]
MKTEKNGANLKRKWIIITAILVVAVTMALFVLNQKKELPYDTLEFSLAPIALEMRAEPMSEENDGIIRFNIERNYQDFPIDKIQSISYDARVITSVDGVYGTINQVADLRNKIVEMGLGNELEFNEGTITYEGKNGIRTMPFKYIVVDTNFPELRAVNVVETELNQVPDYNTLFMATDSEDGDLAIRVEGEVDYGVAAIYELYVVATDSSGNISKKPFFLTVHSNEE